MKIFVAKINMLEKEFDAIVQGHDINGQKPRVNKSKRVWRIGLDVWRVGVTHGSNIDTHVARDCIGGKSMEYLIKFMVRLMIHALFFDMF